MFYGTAKSGKTTTASHFPKSLILGFEKGWNALPGVMAVPVNSWVEFKNYLLMLREEETKEMYQTIIIDTVDIAYDYCTDYICDNNDVNSIKDIPYGGGYGMVQKEFDTCIRKIIQLNYGLVLISHSTERQETDEQGNEYSRLEPTLDKRGRLVCERTCDIIGMSRPTRNEDGTVTTKLFMRETPRYVAGSRFRYLVPMIEFNYDNLTKAIADAVEKEAQENNGKYVTNERTNLYEESENQIPDFDTVIQEAQKLISELMKRDPENKSFITRVIKDNLGTKKLTDATPADTGDIWLVVQELRIKLEKS